MYISSSISSKTCQIKAANIETTASKHLIYFGKIIIIKLEYIEHYWSNLKTILVIVGSKVYSIRSEMREKSKVSPLNRNWSAYLEETNSVIGPENQATSVFK